MTTISTHILDLSRGVAASGVHVALARLDGAPHAHEWTTLTRTVTDADGRVKSLLPHGAAFTTGTYRLRFESGEYFKAQGVAAFHPHIEVTFAITDASRHHHVPLLLSPFGYSTYRGT